METNGEESGQFVEIANIYKAKEPNLSQNGRIISCLTGAVGNLSPPNRRKEMYLT